MKKVATCTSYIGVYKAQIPDVPPKASQRLVWSQWVKTRQQEPRRGWGPGPRLPQAGPQEKPHQNDREPPLLFLLLNRWKISCLEQSTRYRGHASASQVFLSPCTPSNKIIRGADCHLLLWHDRTRLQTPIQKEWLAARDSPRAWAWMDWVVKTVIVPFAPVWHCVTLLVLVCR